MKASLIFFILLIACATVSADLAVAHNYEDVTKFLELNQEDTIALIFVDSSLNEEQAGGIFSGIVTSISHIFSGADEVGSTEKVAQIEREISEETALLQIDVSKPELKEVQESYDVTTVPFLIVFKRGIVVLKEVPTQETHDKILQVLNVNPSAVHAESTEAVSADESSSVVSSTPEATPQPTESVTPATPVAAPVDPPADSIYAPQDVEETSYEPIVLEETDDNQFQNVFAEYISDEPIVSDETEDNQIQFAELISDETSDEPIVSEETGDNKFTFMEVGTDENGDEYVVDSFELNPIPSEPSPTVERPVRVRQEEPQPTAFRRPQVQEKPAEEQKPAQNPDDRRKYVKHHCHNANSHND